MSTEPAPVGGQDMPTPRCPVCGNRVVAVAFCGSCGANMCARRGGGPAWLPLRAYGAAPGEHVSQAVGGEFALSASARSLRQSVPGGLAALLLLLLVLVVFAVLRWQPPLIAISTVGLPLVFPSYL